MSRSTERKIHWRRYFKRTRKRAERLIEAADATVATAEGAMAKAERVGKLRKSFTEIKTLGRLARAFARGEYRQISRSTLLMVVGALVYFLSPIDAILDGVPGLGLVDDAAVLAWVLSEVRAELEDFRAWEAQNA